MKLFQSILVITVFLSLSGCSDVINVDLETAPQKLVIDASIDWLKGTSGTEQTIKLTTTTSYYSPEFPAVSGATVFITNSSRKVFTFPESGNKGEYICTNFSPVIGETYFLTVIVDDQTYTASETLIGTPEMDSIIAQNTAGGMTGDEMEIEFSYPDDGSQNNYYLTGIEYNGVSFPQYTIESDERYQGNRMIQFYSHEDLQSGDELNIRLYGVSRLFFQYFKKILLASGNDDSPFPAMPTLVRGNIVNQTKEENYALGYFRLSEVATRSYTMK